MSGPEEPAAGVARAWRAAAPWLDVTWQFVGAALAGVAVGYGVDAASGSKPFGMLVGGLVGSSLGFYLFIRGSLRLLNKKEQ